MLRALELILAFSFALGVTLPSAAAKQDHPISAGTYDLSLTYGGGILDATLEISYHDDSLVAVLLVGNHEAPVRAGQLKGSTLVLEAATPGTQVRYELEFDADRVKGWFTFQGATGEVSGSRRTRES